MDIGLLTELIKHKTSWKNWILCRFETRIGNPLYNGCVSRQLWYSLMWQQDLWLYRIYWVWKLLKATGLLLLLLTDVNRENVMTWHSYTDMTNLTHTPKEITYLLLGQKTSERNSSIHYNLLICTIIISIISLSCS